MANYNKPAGNEYGEYYQGYIDQVNGENAISAISTNTNSTLKILEQLDEETWNFAYAEGKWTVKQLVQHIIDTERVFAFRALWIARNSQQPLPGFDQDVYVSESRADLKSSEELLEQYKNTRNHTLDLFNELPSLTVDYTGEASGFPLTARACAWIIAGHEIHHVKVLQERYLTS